MEQNNKNIIMQNKDVLVVFGITSLILMTASGLITGDLKWSLSDFLIGGALLNITGLLIILVLRKIKKINSKIFFIIALLTFLFLIWAELAVGLFGTPYSGN